MTHIWIVNGSQRLDSHEFTTVYGAYSTKEKALQRVSSLIDSGVQKRWGNEGCVGPVDSEEERYAALSGSKIVLWILEIPMNSDISIEGYGNGSY